MPKLELDKDGFPALPANFGGGRGNSMIMMRDRARHGRGAKRCRSSWNGRRTSYLKPVTDSTGLTREIRFLFLSVAGNDRSMGPMGGADAAAPPGGGAAPLDNTADSEALPTLPSALQEQLRIETGAKERERGSGCDRPRGKGTLPKINAISINVFRHDRAGMGGRSDWHLAVRRRCQRQSGRDRVCTQTGRQQTVGHL